MMTLCIALIELRPVVTPAIESARDVFFFLFIHLVVASSASVCQKKVGVYSVVLLLSVLKCSRLWPLGSRSNLQPKKTTVFLLYSFAN